MTTAEVFDRTIDVYKKSFGNQLAYAAIIGVIAFAATTFISFIALFVIGFVAIGGGASDTMVLVLVMAVILPLVGLWLALISSGAILMSKRTLYGYRVKLPMKELPQIVGRVFGTLVAIAIMSAPFLGAIIFVIYYAPIIDILFSWTSFILAGGLAIGFAIYSNIFSLAIAAAVFERTTFFGAVKRSWSLVHGEFWKIAGSRAIWIVVIMAITYATQGAAYLVNLLLLGLSSTANQTAFIFITMAVMAITGLVTLAISFITMPLDGIFHAVLYFNQRVKREGLDIEVKLERLSHDFL